MRLLSIIVSIFFFLNSYCQNNYQPEEKLYACMIEKFDSAGVNLKSEILNFESYLINKGILKGSAGKDYVDFFCKAVKENNIPSAIDVDSSIVLTRIPIQDYYLPKCIENLKNIDSVLIINSKFYKLQLALINQFNKTGYEPDSLISAMLSVLDSAAFKNKYYKTLALLLILYTSDFVIDYAAMLPSISSESPEQVGEKNILEVYITNEDKIFIQNKPVKINDLKHQVKHFILKTADKKEVDLPVIGRQMISKGVIHLTNDLGTSYKFYILVQNELISVYGQIRNKYSHKFFKTDYDKLNETEEKIISDLLPLRISDADLKNKL